MSMTKNEIYDLIEKTHDEITKLSSADPIQKIFKEYFWAKHKPESHPNPKKGKGNYINSITQHTAVVTYNTLINDKKFSNLIQSIELFALIRKTDKNTDYYLLVNRNDSGEFDNTDNKYDLDKGKQSEEPEASTNSKTAYKRGEKRLHHLNIWNELLNTWGEACICYSFTPCNWQRQKQSPRQLIRPFDLPSQYEIQLITQNRSYDVSSLALKATSTINAPKLKINNKMISRKNCDTPPRTNSHSFATPNIYDVLPLSPNSNTKSNHHHREQTMFYKPFNPEDTIEAAPLESSADTETLLKNEDPSPHHPSDTPSLLEPNATYWNFNMPNTSLWREFSEDESCCNNAYPFCNIQ